MLSHFPSLCVPFPKPILLSHAQHTTLSNPEKQIHFLRTQKKIPSLLFSVFVSSIISKLQLGAMSAGLSSRCCYVLAMSMILAAIGAQVSSNSEGDALYALRRSLSDPDNVLQSWDPNLVNPCTWFHISCDQNNHVTRVDLGNSNLSGHLVPELGKLEHLQYLELYKNNIKGSIPAELGNLKNLISLDLYHNNITGSIPSSLGKLKSLVFLRLNDNQLTGPIPRELTGISTLKVVDVSSNNLCGTIPTTGPFEHIPLNNFESNPRLEGPELQGLASYDTNCS